MLQGLPGKVVLVTGAAGEIGAATCRRLVAEGARVVVADVDGGAAETLADELGREAAVPVVSDVRRAAGAAAGVEAAVAAFGRLDAAFVNAGVECVPTPIAAFSEADYERVFDVNVRGVFLTSQAVVAHLLGAGHGGSLLLTASIAGLQGSAAAGVYSASKHAVIGIMRSLARELGPLGIRVNALCPGVVDTRMMRSLEDGFGAVVGIDGRDVQASIAAQVPLGRYATATEVASTAAWVLSDEVPYAHGELFTVTGGILL